MNLSELLNIRKVENADVGLELEIEGDIPVLTGSQTWETKQDGSLRGGYEYVTRGPIAIERVPKALAIIARKFAATNAKPSFSFRTSVHVHMNMSNLEFKDILKVIYMYWLLEPVLIEASGETRKGNRFCLSTQDSDTPIFLLEGVLNYNSDHLRHMVSAFRAERAKYSAINLASLRTFGTVEVRTMEGNLDVDRLSDWAFLLNKMKLKALSYESVEAIDAAVDKMGVQVFVQDVCEELFERYAYQDLEGDILLQKSLLINIPYLSRKVYNASKNPPVHEGQPKRKAPVYNTFIDDVIDRGEAVPIRETTRAITREDWEAAHARINDLANDIRRRREEANATIPQMAPILAPRN